ncbi:MAG TPA: tetratricopeptide repeat protein, partial [Xanthomonadales bacterium]|nr:tetratricopeptide repeat protein [Xanthomonadales bacterium]
MKYHHTKLCSLLLGLVLNTPLWADYQSGVQAYQQGDFVRALEEWQKVIESPPADVHPGERAETLYAVAMLFWLGQGIQQDTVTAAGFLRQAAELNHAGAQSKLGYLYLIGQGVPASYFEASKWLEMAARQGDVDAQYNLAVMYRDGIGATADPVKALQWFEEAAANGDPVSTEVIAEYKRQGTLQSAAQPAKSETQTKQDTETDVPQTVAAEDQPITEVEAGVSQ